MILLLPKLRTHGQVIMAVNKIQRICQEPVTIEGKALRVQLTFGVTLSPQGAPTITELLGCAAPAMLLSALPTWLGNSSWTLNFRPPVAQPLAAGLNH